MSVKLKMGPRMPSTIVAIALIKDKHGKADVQAVMECPRCKGKLHYSVTSYNGHTSGKCETDGCLGWVE